MINEEIYTQSSAQTAALFARDAQLFAQYHIGYTQQRQEWPLCPLQILQPRINSLIERSSHPLEAADVGCGDAALQKAYRDDPRISFTSYDLVAVEPFVLQRNMTDLGVRDKYDLAVYSLSIMATDQGSIFLEASNILKKGGRMFLVEISSRLTEDFATQMGSFGFKLVELHNYGYLFFAEFTSSKQVKGVKGNETLLKPCLYKRR